MNNDSLQRLSPDVCVQQATSPPDFRFTNYSFAQQRLNEKPLPQNLLSAPDRKSAG
jgi:hypothetical protein